MSLPYPDPDDNPGVGGPGDPDYIPPTGPGTKLAAIVTGSTITFTADQIIAAGGPWASFKIRVTPINASGTGTPDEVDYPA